MPKYFLIIMSLILIILSLFLFYNYSKNQSKPLLSASALITPKATVILTPTSSPSVTPTPSTMSLKKQSYSIALFGDSMIDTMGENLEPLQKVLANTYPDTKFNLYNYGIGGQNVEQGLMRFESSFVNRERNFPPLSTLRPDILIIGSFAYNPFSTHDKNKHYTLLKELITKSKAISSNIYLLAEIAPLKNGFGSGKNGVNMPEDFAYQHAKNIIEQLDNIVNLASSENVPLINAYHKSRIDGIFGDPYLVNKDDGIHPSAAGHAFTAKLIIASIKFD